MPEERGIKVVAKLSKKPVTFQCGFVAGDTGCNICEGCDICDACDNCDACNTPCDTHYSTADTGSAPNVCDVEESFCTGAHEQGQLASDNIAAAPVVAVDTDDIIIKTTPQGLFQELAAWVAEAAAHGDQVDSGAWTADIFTGDFLSGDDLQTLIDGINSLNGVQFAESVPDGGVIFADFIQAIMDALENLELYENACHHCNVACDTCDACDTDCDICDACIDCNACVTCYGCVTCIGPNNSWGTSWTTSWTTSWPFSFF